VKDRKDSCVRCMITTYKSIFEFKIGENTSGLRNVSVDMRTILNRSYIHATCECGLDSSG
jgi:hypothetical protein